MLKKRGHYPYTSFHYFLDHSILPECLTKSWVAQNFQNDTEEIRAFLSSSIDTAQLQEMTKSSALVEAPNIDKKPDRVKLQKLFAGVKDKKERNILVLQAYEEGYSQHKIAEVLGLSQPTVYGIIRRTSGAITITLPLLLKARYIVYYCSGSLTRIPEI